MSFLQAETDSALCELLAIVDAWEPGASAAEDEESAPPSASIEANDCVHGKERKRSRNPAADARRRLKKKEEREALVALVLELQGRRDKLRRASRRANRCSSRRQYCSPMATANRALSQSYSVVSEELAASLEANRKLKTETAKNNFLIRALRDAISAPPVEMDPAPCIDTAMATHRAVLRDMRMHIDTVFEGFPRLSSSRPFFLRSDIAVDSAGSPTVEIAVALHLPWNFRRASLAFTKELADLSPFGGAIVDCLRTRAESAEQPCSTDSRSAKEINLPFNGLVQKHQASDSLVVMWSSRSLHPTAGTVFNGRSRMRISSLSSDQTLLEAFTDVSAREMLDTSSSSQVDPELSRSARSTLVGALGSHVTYKHKAFLKLSLTSSGRGDLASMLIS